MHSRSTLSLQVWARLASQYHSGICLSLPAPQGHKGFIYVHKYFKKITKYSNGENTEVTIFWVSTVYTVLSIGKLLIYTLSSEI